MSLQSRYDSLLKDMITLLQQALFRFFTEKPVDIGKFKQYFCSFNKGLTELQQHFHQRSTKFSKNLTKLSQLFQKSSPPNKISLQPTPMKNLQPSLSLNKPKTSHNYTTLNIIGEQEEQQYEKQKQRRSGTAQGKRRSQNFVIDFSQGNFRPKTGVSRQNKRYKSKDNSNSQTISHDEDYSHFRTFNSKQIDQSMSQFKRERKSFYNQLQKQHSGKAELIYENMVKIPKKKSISTHRWSFKINKLF